MGFVTRQRRVLAVVTAAIATLAVIASCTGDGSREGTVAEQGAYRPSLPVSPSGPEPAPDRSESPGEAGDLSPAQELEKTHIEWVRGLQSFVVEADVDIEYDDGASRHQAIRATIEQPNRIRVVEIGEPEVPLLVCDGTVIYLRDHETGDYLVDDAPPAFGGLVTKLTTPPLYPHFWSTRVSALVDSLGSPVADQLADQRGSLEIQRSYEGTEVMGDMPCHRARFTYSGVLGSAEGEVYVSSEGDPALLRSILVRDMDGDRARGLGEFARVRAIEMSYSLWDTDPSADALTFELPPVGGSRSVPEGAGEPLPLLPS
ncbi:MAG: hypothetical protein GF320_11470 [Armatimonadia bacterium]|nr:hypothetical protein [Armatimonadia bacterium]